ncbi:S9 family peptidase [Chitinophaga tropicalis]|uniref:Proline-specific endopeptidase n=1 Tax=Chitinophaga tropicalis TaxID=2683588 RepID=A0A7K1UB10_9BACT|nr:S9 family peptidase [Chitinophaga tropicalis]MVT11567.1 prolyl oligopeptidase family serine peptidase [Chitinophaga tropicalis]
MRRAAAFCIMLSGMGLFACKENNKKMPEEVISTIKPPVAEQIDTAMTIHGDTRIDKYYWMNDRNDPRVISYLKAENAYLDTIMKPFAKLRQKLYDEMRGRIMETDASVPYLKEGYYYYTRYTQGKEYPVYCRKKGSLEATEEIILDVNVLALGHDYYQVGGLTVSPDGLWLAYGVDTVSRRKYTIYIKNLQTGELLPETIAETSGSVAWASDNKTFFYTVKNPVTLREERIKRHTAGTDAAKDKDIFTEKDETYTTRTYRSKSGKFIMIESSSTLSSEFRVLDASKPDDAFRVFQPRQKDMLYDIDHQDNQFYIVTNWEAVNFRLMQCPQDKTERSNWKEVIPHRTDVLLQGIELFREHLVLSERKNGLTQLRVINTRTKADHYLHFEEPAYVASISVNPEFDTKTLRYTYASMTTPVSTYDYDMDAKTNELRKRQEVLGGYDPKDYVTERLYVTARDGVKVPVSIVYKKGFEKNGKKPLLLYGYGSYGFSVEPGFNSNRLSLLDRGFAYAIAHIRGGEEMGRQWYEDGKLFKKMNTFTDFIDCADYLVAQHYTDSSHLYAMGGSAGGLLMGAVVNMRPGLWKGVVAAVPFVDVLTTMLDESIPLTTGEFDEWGNPKNKDSYEYMKQYSPYDNVKAHAYPNMLVTTGLHDSQVQYWEPAKWVAKLRELKTDKNLLLLHTNMEAGHGGASGRFKPLEDVALQYAFLLGLEEK